MRHAEHLRDSLSTSLLDLVEAASRLPVVGVLVRAGLRDQKNLAKDMSASIAYFTFLSLFPLSLGLFALGGSFLESAEVQARLNNFLIRTLPASSEFVAGNIDSLIRSRGTLGIASAIVLMWSASKMVGAISRGINNALGFERPYAVYFSPLRNLGLTLMVSMLVFLTLALAPMVEVLTELELGFIGSRANAFIDYASGHAAGFAVSAMLLSAIYWLVPYQRMPWRDLLPGILVAASAIELGKELFVLYIGNLSRFNAIYGSVSSIIVLLIWLYFSARVVLYGTEVICVYRESRESEEKGGERGVEAAP